MRFLCSTFGSAGDVFPLLGLALELRRRGHDVTFATNPRYGDVARRHGLPFEPLGTEAEFAAAIRDPALWHPRRAFRHVFESFRPALRRQYDLHANLAAAGPVVGVTSCLGFGALLAQEKLGLPVVTVHCQPAVIWSDHRPPTLPGLAGPRWLKSALYRVGERFVIDPVVGPFLNGWRRDLGLPPMRRVTRWWHSPYAVVCLFPDWYAPPQPDWPGNLTQTDFPLWNDGSGAGLAADVAAFLDRGAPPLVFTPGSANVQGRRFFEAAVEACGRLGRRGVLLTEYPEQVPGPLPAAVAHFRYVPLDRLLPRAAGFVHHGGVGSTAEGLAAGVPQVLMPLAHDQFDNADRVARLGGGTWLGVRRFTGPRLARHLAHLLASGAVAAACRAAAERLRAGDGLRRAAAAIEGRLERG